MGASGELALLHLNLLVADVDRSIDFYRRWFGFTTPPRVYSDGTVFVGDAHEFDLAFHPGHPPRPPASTVHFGFRCLSPEPVLRLRAELREAGVPLTETCDEESYVNVKLLDPDGYEIEVYWEQTPVTGA